MSSMLTTFCCSFVKLKDVSLSCRMPPSSFHVSLKYTIRLPEASSRLVSVATRCTPMCLLGGKGKSQSGNEDSPWKSLQNAMGDLRKEKSVQDILREQLQNQEFADGGGAGGTPPRNGGDSSGGSEDDDDFSEILQRTLATISLILIYVYITWGEDVTEFTMDCIRLLFTRKKTRGLALQFEKLDKFLNNPLDEEVEETVFLEDAILNTSTWWHTPSPEVNECHPEKGSSSSAASSASSY